jgi:hypothetical protein
MNHRGFANRTLRVPSVREAVSSTTHCVTSMHGCMTKAPKGTMQLSRTSPASVSPIRDCPEPLKMGAALCGAPPPRPGPTAFNSTLARTDLSDHTGLLVVNEMELNECRARLGLEVDSKQGSKRRSVSSLVFKRLAPTPSAKCGQVLHPRRKVRQMVYTHITVKPCLCHYENYCLWYAEEAVQP